MPNWGYRKITTVLSHSRPGAACSLQSQLTSAASSAFLFAELCPRTLFYLVAPVLFWLAQHWRKSETWKNVDAIPHRIKLQQWTLTESNAMNISVHFYVSLWLWSPGQTPKANPTNDSYVFLWKFPVYWQLCKDGTNKTNMSIWHTLLCTLICFT